MEKKKEKKTNSVSHKILTILGTIFCVIMIPMLVINCSLIIKSHTDTDLVPNIGGIFPMIILTDSMDPVFSSGDLIICRRAEPKDIKQGDVICFYDPAGNGITTVTHRVMAVTTDENGDPAWQTKGDANNTEDAQLVPARNLLGTYQKHFSDLGNIAMFTQTTQGLIVCVVCPIILFVAYDMIRRRMYEKEKQADTKVLLEELNTLRAEKKED